MQSHPQSIRIQLYAIPALAALGHNNAAKCDQITLALVKAMKQYATNENIHVQVGGALDMLFEGNEELTQEKLIKAGGIEVVVASMLNFSQSLSVQIMGSLVLRHLNLDDEAVSRRMGEAGAIQALMTAINVHGPTNEQLCINVLILSSALANAKENAELFHESDAISAVIDVMRQRCQTSKIITTSCGLLVALTEMEPDFASEIARQDGIDVIFSAIRLNIADEDVVYHGCGALHRIVPAAAKTMDTTSPFVAADGIGIVLSALRQFPHSIDIFNCSLSIFQCFFQVEEKRADERLKTATTAVTDADVQDGNNVARQIVREGGIEMALSALDSHGIEYNVAWNGCGLLSMLVAEVTDRVDGRTKFLAADGIQIVIKVLHNHSESLDIFTMVALIFSHTLQLDGPERHVIDAFKATNFIETVLIAVKNVATKKSNIMVNVLKQLVYVIHGDTSSQQRSGDAGAIELCLNLIPMYSDDQMVQAACIWLLGTVIRDMSALQTHFIELGGLDIVIKCVQRQSDNAVILRSSVAVWAILESVRDMSTISSQLSDLVLTAMIGLQHDEDVLRSGLYALRRLVENDANRVLIAKDRGLRTIIDGMKRFDSLADIQQLGCDTLKALWAGANAGFTADGISVVISALRQHVHHKDVAVSACGALVCLIEQEKYLFQVNAEGGIDVLHLVITNNEFPEAVSNAKLVVKAVTALRSRSNN